MIESKSFGREAIILEIRIERTKTPKQKPTDESKLGFGNYYTDHMFAMNYDDGEGWHDARIIPYQPIALDPAAMVLHYGQEVFEGLKAYKCPDGHIRMFRPDKNMERLNNSCDRLCIPQIDPFFVIDAMKKLVEVEKDWIPASEGTSLYIRPFIFATDAQIGVHPASHYLFLIILSPVGAYFEEGLKPVKIYIESKYVRAVRGGMGFAKTGGNYAVSLKAQVDAEKVGYSQVLWLDGVERKYIEEVGAMNVFFVLGDEVVTPALQGSILPGVTRDSCIHLLKSWGYKVSERKLAAQELVDAYDNGTFKEAFGSGTAAVISPIGELKYEDKVMTINNGKIGEISQRLYDTITGIQKGTIKGPEGWSVIVE